MPRMAEIGELFCRSLATILDRGGSDLDIALQILAERLVGKRHVLADALISSVLAGGFDRRSCTRRRRAACRDYPCRPRSALYFPGRRVGRETVKKISFFSASLRSSSLLIPVLQVGEPLKRPGSTHRDPERQRAHRFALRRLRPRSATYGRRYRPFSASGWLISKLTTSSNSLFQAGRTGALESAIAPLLSALLRRLPRSWRAYEASAIGLRPFQAVPAGAFGDLSVGCEDQAFDARQRIDQPEAFFGLEDAADLGEGVGVGPSSATTVALVTRSTGSAVLGSKTCEYHLSLI